MVEYFGVFWSCVIYFVTFTAGLLFSFIVLRLVKKYIAPMDLKEREKQQEDIYKRMMMDQMKHKNIPMSEIKDKLNQMKYRR